MTYRNMYGLTIYFCCFSVMSMYSMEQQQGEQDDAEYVEFSRQISPTETPSPTSASSSDFFPSINSLWQNLSDRYNGHDYAVIESLRDNTFKNKYRGVNAINIRNRATDILSQKKDIAQLIVLGQLYGQNGIQPTDYECGRASKLLLLEHNKRSFLKNKELQERAQARKKILAEFDQETAEVSQSHQESIDEVANALNLFELQVNQLSNSEVKKEQKQEELDGDNS